MGKRLTLRSVEEMDVFKINDDDDIFILTPYLPCRDIKLNPILAQLIYSI